jgi:hypothetical protein
MEFTIMHLLVIYCVVVLVGEVLAYGLGRLIEDIYPSWSMLIYMAMFFGVLWAGWPFSVQLTERWDRMAGRTEAVRRP